MLQSFAYVAHYRSWMENPKSWPSAVTFETKDVFEINVNFQIETKMFLRLTLISNLKQKMFLRFTLISNLEIALDSQGQEKVNQDGMLNLCVDN